MLIQQKIGNLNTIEINNRIIDTLSLQWYETNKRILHKRTKAGREIVMKFLKEDPDFKQDDVIFKNDTHLVVIEIQACEAIILRPVSMFEMGCLCYEIGNKHLPLFMEDDELLVPYEAPLFRLLTLAGFNPQKGERKLLKPVKTTVSPHKHSDSLSLFSKILQLTTPSTDAR